MDAKNLTVSVQTLLGEHHTLKAGYGLLARRMHQLTDGVNADRDIFKREEEYREMKRKARELNDTAMEWAKQIAGLRDNCLMVARTSKPATLKYAAAIHDAECDISNSAGLLSRAFWNYTHACEVVVGKRERGGQTNT